MGPYSPVSWTLLDQILSAIPSALRQRIVQTGLVSYARSSGASSLSAMSTFSPTCRKGLVASTILRASHPKLTESTVCMSCQAVLELLGVLDKMKPYSILRLLLTVKSWHFILESHQINTVSGKPVDQSFHGLGFAPGTGDFPTWQSDNVVYILRPDHLMYYQCFSC